MTTTGYNFNQHPKPKAAARLWLAYVFSMSEFGDSEVVATPTDGWNGLRRKNAVTPEGCDKPNAYTLLETKDDCYIIEWTYPSNATPVSRRLSGEELETCLMQVLQKCIRSLMLSTWNRPILLYSLAVHVMYVD